MSYANKYNLRPADRLVTPIFTTGLTKHHVIYLGIDQQDTEWISENHATLGVRLVTAQDYFARNKNVRIEAFKGSNQERHIAVMRAYSDMGKPYNLVHYNCEHHATFVQTGFATSKQVLLVIGTLTTFLIIWLFTAVNNKKYKYGKL